MIIHTLTRQSIVREHINIGLNFNQSTSDWFILGEGRITSSILLTSPVRAIKGVDKFWDLVVVVGGGGGGGFSGGES